MPDMRVLADAAGARERLVAWTLAAQLGQYRVASAPPGFGKTLTTHRAAVANVQAGRRFAAVFAQNDQAVDFLRRVAGEHPDVRLVWLASDSPSRELLSPDERRRWVVTKPGEVPRGPLVLVATGHKLMWTVGHDLAVDVAVLDEAYMVPSGNHLQFSALLPAQLLIGDGGQIDPWTPVSDDRWRGDPKGVLAPAPVALRAYRPSTPLDLLPASLRLAPEAVAVLQPAFYADLPFSSAATSGDRSMRLIATPSGTRGRALRHAARHGWAWAELPARLATDDDPAMVETIVNLVALLLGSGAELICERHGARRIAPSRIAVGAARNLQVTRLRSALDRVGLREVVVGTANRLQGLEFDVTVVWHPLSGRAGVDEFYGEAGRMNVLCSRHRHACIVVGRAGVASMLEEAQPMLEPRLGADNDPAFDGWAAHVELTRRLDSHRIAV